MAIGRIPSNRNVVPLDDELMGVLDTLMPMDWSMKSMNAVPSLSAAGLK